MPVLRQLLHDSAQHQLVLPALRFGGLLMWPGLAEFRACHVGIARFDSGFHSSISFKVSFAAISRRSCLILIPQRSRLLIEPTHVPCLRRKRKQLRCGAAVLHIPVGMNRPAARLLAVECQYRKCEGIWYQHPTVQPYPNCLRAITSPSLA